MTTPQTPEDVLGELWERLVLFRRVEGFVVTNYGAKGDGSNDDLPAIRSALAACTQAGGGRLIFPTGIYKISAPIGNGTVGYTGIKFEGDGDWQSQIVTTGNFPVVTGAFHNCRWENIVWNADGQGAEGANIYLDKTYMNHVKILGWNGFGMKVNDGTYGDLGLLNHVNDVHIDQNTGYGIFGTYMFTDSWITECNIGSTLANLSLEGGPVRVLGNHLNGSPRNNIELRGNRRVTISDNIMEGSRREALIYTMPPWLESDAPQVQITGNAISNGGKDAKGTYSAIKFQGVASNKLVNDLSVTGNIFACDDPDAGWLDIVNAPNADRISVTGNQWKTAYSAAEPVSAPQATDLNVSGNSGGGNVQQVRVIPEANYSGTRALPNYSNTYLLKMKLTGDTVISMAPGVAGRNNTITLEVTQDATGGRKLTLNNVTWASGAVPQVSSTPNAKDIIHLTWTGTAWIGVVGAQMVS